MQKEYGVSGEKLYSLKYYTDIDDYYSCLLEEDKLDAPLRKMLRLGRFYYQIAVCAVLAIVIAVAPPIDKNFLFVVLGVALLFVIALLYQNKTGGSNEKFIKKTWDKARDSGVKQLTELSLYEFGMQVRSLDIYWEVLPSDIADVFETDRLFVIRIRDEKGVKCRDLVHIIVPKRIFDESSIENVQKYFFAILNEV